jgi:hypothetical protein
MLGSEPCRRENSIFLPCHGPGAPPALDFLSHWARLELSSARRIASRNYEIIHRSQPGVGRQRACCHIVRMVGDPQVALASCSRAPRKCLRSHRHPCHPNSLDFQRDAFLNSTTYTADLGSLSFSAVSIKLMIANAAAADPLPPWRILLDV